MVVPGARSAPCHRSMDLFAHRPQRVGSLDSPHPDFWSAGSLVTYRSYLSVCRRVFANGVTVGTRCGQGNWPPASCIMPRCPGPIPSRGILSNESGILWRIAWVPITQWSPQVLDGGKIGREGGTVWVLFSGYHLRPGRKHQYATLVGRSDVVASLKHFPPGHVRLSQEPLPFMGSAKIHGARKENISAMKHFQEIPSGISLFCGWT